MADNKNKVKGTQGEDTPTSPKDEGNKEEKTLTQGQFDKALKERLSRERKENNEKIKEIKTETERLAKLSAEEKEKELAEQSKRDTDERDKSISIRENRLEALEVFSESKVPTNLVDYVISEDKKETLKNAKEFSESYNESVAKSVAEQLKGTAPKDITKNSKGKTKKKVTTAF